jgi:hypothetical protein
MAILDRPLFQRRLTRDELMTYGLPAFANGGIVYANTGGLQMQSAELKPGGKVPGRKYYNKETGKFEVYQPEPNTAITDLVTDTQYEDKILRDLETPPVLTTTETEPLPEFTPELKPIPERKQKLMEEEEDKKKKQKEIESLDELKQKYLEKSELYKELLGNPEEMIKQQGFLQLAQFGLNLASAQGANFLDKVAKSAKDPLNAFAELGRKAYEDERAIELLALEATEEDIAAEKEAQLEKELAEIEGTEGTKFQSDLDTIQGLLPNLDSLEQVKIAKGLRLADDEETQINSMTETLINSSALYAADPIKTKQIAKEVVTGKKSNQAQDQGEGALGLPTISTTEEYDALPKGAEFYQEGFPNLRQVRE